MAVIVNGDGILSGVSSLTTALDDLNTGRGTVTGVATVGTLQLGAGVSISSPRTQNAAIFTNNTEFLTVDDAGRVGVGTVTPNSDAHPENGKKINVGFITARSIAGDIDGNTLVIAGLSTFTDDVTFKGAAANITFDKSTDDLIFDDNAQAKFGTSGDLSVYHDGTHTYLDNNTGNLIVKSDGQGLKLLAEGHVILGDNDDTTRMIRCLNGGAVELMHNGTKKFETSVGGGTLTGDYTVTGNIYVGNHLSILDSDGASDMLKIGASEDLRIYHYNNNTYIRQHTDLPLVIGGTTTGQSLYLQPKSGENSAIFKPNAEVELYHDNVLKFETGTNFNYIYAIANGNPAGLSIRNTNNGSDYDHASLRLESRNNAVYGTVYADKANAALRLGYETTGNTFNVFNDGTVRAAGIKFGSDTAAENTLDDYEEGTWTPDWRGASALGTTTYGSYNVASYVKIGNQVTVRGYSELNGNSGGSGFWFINNLPFIVGGGDDRRYRTVGSVMIENFNLPSDVIDVVIYVERNNNDAQLRANRDNTTSSPNLSVNNDTNFEIYFTITYPTV